MNPTGRRCGTTSHPNGCGMIIFIKQTVNLVSKATADGQADLLVAAADFKLLDGVHGDLQM